MKRILLLLSLILFFQTAYASGLDMARQQGRVKEMPNGYLEVVDPGTTKLVESINAKRREAYSKISRDTGVDLEVVGAQAAQKIQEKLQSKK